MTRAVESVSLNSRKLVSEHNPGCWDLHAVRESNYLFTGTATDGDSARGTLPGIQILAVHEDLR